MSSALHLARNLRVSVAFAALSLCFGCSSSTRPIGGGGAAGEGGSLALGGEGGAGTAGSGGADSESRGGASNDCQIQECFVANTCLDRCGGDVVYVGCCACVPPALNQTSCSQSN